MKIAFRKKIEVSSKQCLPIGVRMLHWAVGRRGIGHFIGIALGVSATLMFFNMVYPVASSMFQSSITTMQSINSGILNGTLSGA